MGEPDFEEAHLMFKKKIIIDEVNDRGNRSVGDILEDDEIDVLIKMAKKAPTEHLYLYKFGDTWQGQPETVEILPARLPPPPAPGSGEELGEPIDEYFLNSSYGSTKPKFVNISKLSKLLLHLFQFSTDGLTINQLKDVASILRSVYETFDLNTLFDPALPDVHEYMVLYHIIDHIASYEAMELDYKIEDDIVEQRGGEVLKLTQEEKDKLKQSDRVKKIKRKMGTELSLSKGRLLIKQVLDKGLSDDLIESIGKKYEPAYVRKTIDTNLGALKRKKRVSKRKKRVSERKKRVSKRKKPVSERKKQVSERKKPVSESKKRVSESKKRVSKRKKKKRKGVSSR